MTSAKLSTITADVQSRFGDITRQTVGYNDSRHVHWMETSLGRYRIVNNTFVHIAGTDVARAAVEAHFGLESVEMYNNIFYSNQPANEEFLDNYCGLPLTILLSLFSHPDYIDLYKTQGVCQIISHI